MRDIEREEVRLCCCLAVVAIETDGAQVFGPGDWEKHQDR